MLATCIITKVIFVKDTQVHICTSLSNLYTDISILKLESWLQSVLLVEETKVHEKVTDLLQVTDKLYHSGVLSTLCLSEI
jgi:hypothetical protein